MPNDDDAADDDDAATGPDATVVAACVVACSEADFFCDTWSAVDIAACTAACEAGVDNLAVAAIAACVDGGLDCDEIRACY